MKQDVLRNKIGDILAGIIFILFYAYCFISCDNNITNNKYTPPVFSEIIEVTPNRFNIDIVSGDIGDILVKDSLLFATSFDGKNVFQVFNKNTGKFIKGIAPRGNGPGEYVDWYMQLLITPNNNYGFYSITTRNLYLIPDSLILEHNPPRKEIALYPKGLYDVSIMGNMFLGQAGDKRFIIHDNTGKEIYSYDKHLALDIKTPDIIEYLNRGRKEVTIKPDVSKFACATFRGAALELFSLQQDSISSIREYWYYPPKIRLKGESRGKHDKYATDKDCIVGFGDLVSTNKYIYATFYGKKHEEYQQNKYADIIYVFDWNGNPVKAYKINGGVRKIAIDEKEGKMYIVTKYITGENDLAWFKL